MKVYDKIWEDYVELYDKFTFDIQEELLSFIANSVYGNVIDAGCGVGKLFSYLDENEDVKKVLGIEKNVVMKEKAYEKTMRLKGDFGVISEDVCNLVGVDEVLDFEPDVICAINLTHILSNQVAFFREAYELLKIGGCLIVSAPNENLDFDGKILPHISSIFEGISDDRFGFDEYVKINKKIVELSNSPLNLCSLEDISKVLRSIGFKIVFGTNYHYLGCNYTVIAQKI
jgi:SAM-dependent methyltransferase